ncbi:alpha/beta hydrolase [Paenibacillus sp. JX-17]|uniref:Alpha/beta hydrolase n=1 Tax=Paenibacillus lacisoli TaxID=3064525 RepID=A0ABT9CE48_9BACL|nr:alpha/beta hydrolase [Paenibacillus sp. JX-17]MDO7907545.1 alpha/beta hydrolase [Paenibacillus sp. JX-17]
MQHIYRQGSDPHAPVLLMLHGTGGNEHDLLPLAELISPESSVLGVRGNVLENGMPRFFRRLAEGIFDEEDLIFRTAELRGFIDEAAEQYGFDRSSVVAIGYSNGANIAASLLFHYKDALAGAILHHAMVPLRGLELPNLSGTPVWMGSGHNDPLIPADQSRELADLLQGAGAEVEMHWESFGHQLTRTEVDAAAAWFARTFKS